MLSANKKPLIRTSLPKSKEVLIIVDFINPFDFNEADNLLSSALAAAKSTSKLKKRLIKKGVPVIYANDNYGTWHSDFKDILRSCLKLTGQRGEIAKILSPKKKDLVILKPQHSAFHSTPLEHLLSEIEADKIIICGVACDICVFLTATDARMLGYEVWVPEDCTAAETPERKVQALRQLNEVFKCSTKKIN